MSKNQLKKKIRIRIFHSYSGKGDFNFSIKVNKWFE